MTLSPQPPQTTPAPQLRRPLDLGVAAALWVLATALIVMTNDMGFVRDEAFYFSHAEDYQDWFVKVESGGKARRDALERKAILDTWRANSEHPPLDKVLFGWSWRTFGRKLRPISALRVDDGEILMDINELGPAHGFEQGSRIWLLKPQIVGQSPDTVPRRYVQGKVLERKPDHARVRLDKSADLALLKETCLPSGIGTGGVIRRTGCEALEQRKLYVMSESDAMRFPGAVFGGLLVALLYLAARLMFVGKQTAWGPGRAAQAFAVVAGVGWLCLPQPFYHAHLACFDMTITTMLFATTVAYHRALRSRAWILPTAVLWGFSLLAKHNALLLPIALIGHWLWDAIAERRFAVQLAPGPWLPRVPWLVAGAVLAVPAWFLHPLLALAVLLLPLTRFVRISAPPVPTVFFVMVPVGFGILVAGWPLLWVDTLDNFLRWLEFHLHHEHYMQQYFGRVLAYPPFPPEFAWVMTALTWPLVLLLAVAIGLLAVYWPRRRPDWLLLLQTWRQNRKHAPQRESDSTVPLNVASQRREDTAAEMGRQADARAYREKMRLSGPLGLDDYGRTAELRSWDRLVLLGALWPMALISIPGTPIFGGTKHWMLAYAFMLLIAARGMQAIWRRLADAIAPADGAETDRLGVNPGSVEAALMRQFAPQSASWWRGHALPQVLAWAMALAVLLPSAQATADSHPQETAYYNELIGGIPGAAAAGMQRQFWGGTTRALLEEVNRRAPQNALIFFHKAAWGAYMMYQREGWFRRDLRYTSDAGTPTALGFYHHQKDHDDYELDLWRTYKWRTPIAQWSLDGVPMLSVYEAPTVKK